MHRRGSGRGHSSRASFADAQIALPLELMDILRWHVEQLETAVAPMRDSNLLLPSDTGEFRAASCLDRPFGDITKAIGLKKHITPRAMRRTFNDLCRRAEVRDVVTRSISGHLTEEMQRHYSTVAPESSGRVWRRWFRPPGSALRCRWAERGIMPSRDLQKREYPDQVTGRGTHWGTHEVPAAAKSGGAYRIRTCDFHRVRSRKQQPGATDRNGQEPAQRRQMVI
jgi:hypothetical protein